LFIIIIKPLYLRKKNPDVARTKNSRIVFDPPKFKGFKPFGYYAPEKDPVKLFLEEYTALRLCDYELLTQAEAAVSMNISRPTFTRLYESARRKVAKAFTESREIEMEKGHSHFSADWYHCLVCNVFFNNPGKALLLSECPLCHSSQIEILNYEDRDRIERR
jgi:uncharacterized protein